MQHIEAFRSLVLCGPFIAFHDMADFTDGSLEENLRDISSKIEAEYKQLKAAAAEKGATCYCIYHDSYNFKLEFFKEKGGSISYMSKQKPICSMEIDMKNDTTLACSSEISGEYSVIFEVYC